MLLCKRCAKELKGKQKNWCSQRCSHLGLKKLWAIRNREKVNSYNREYRKLNPGGFKYKYFIKGEDCFFCKSKQKLNKHHLDYDKNSVVVLCNKCHSKYHFLIKHSVFKND